MDLPLHTFPVTRFQYRSEPRRRSTSRWSNALAVSANSRSIRFPYFLHSVIGCEDRGSLIMGATNTCIFKCSPSDFLKPSSTTSQCEVIVGRCKRFDQQVFLAHWGQLKILLYMFCFIGSLTFSVCYTALAIMHGWLQLSSRLSSCTLAVWSNTGTWASANMQVIVGPSFEVLVFKRSLVRSQDLRELSIGSEQVQIMNDVDHDTGQKNSGSAISAQVMFP